MAEKKVAAHVCEIPGCIHHADVDFSCSPNGDTKLPKVQYQAKVHYKDVDTILEHAAAEMARKLQAKAGRKGTFPKGRRVDVNADGMYTKTMEDLEAEFNALTPEAQEVKRREMQALLNMMNKSK